MTADVYRVGVAIGGRQSVAERLWITVDLTLLGTLVAVQPTTAERTMTEGGGGGRGTRTVLLCPVRETDTYRHPDLTSQIECVRNASDL